MTRLGLAGYPAMRIVALAETGTRGLLGAVLGGKGDRNEAPLARKLVPLLGEGMLLLADRAYDAAGLLAAVAAAGAHFLVRGSASRKPAVLEVLPDGSYLSQIDGLKVRIIEADLDVTGADGTRIGDNYRLITTLTDWRRYPAGELIRLYRALGDRGRLPGATPYPARRVRAALPRPGRRRAGTVGAAHGLPADPDGDDRRRRVRAGHRP